MKALCSFCLLMITTISPQTPAAMQNAEASSPHVVGVKDYAERRIAGNRLTAEELPPLSEKALAGDLQAAELLGTAYQLGCPGAPADPKEAIRWYTLAADRGSSIAANQIGMFYDPSASGNFYKKDPEEALKWFRKSAERNDAVGQYNSGKMLVELKRYPEAVEWLRKAMENGNAIAEQYLVDLYDRGKALPGKSKHENWREALTLFQRLAAEGNAGAQYVMGNTYLHGWFGADRNPAAAVDLLRKAAEQDMAYAEHMVGDLYWDGKGVPKDKQEAVKWYLKAADGAEPDSEAQLNLALIYEGGNIVPQDFAAAYMWYELAREGGAEHTQTPRSVTEAGSWIRLHHRFTRAELEDGKKRLREWKIEHGQMLY